MANSLTATVSNLGAVETTTNKTGGLNTTTQSSELETNVQKMQSSQIKNRKQPALNNPVIVLHPNIQSGNQKFGKDLPRQYIPSQLTP